MNSAMPIAIGTPISNAIPDDIRVPNSNAAMPNIGGSSSGSHTWVVNRLPVLPANAGSALKIRKMAIAAMMTSSSPPEPAARPRNTRSPTRTDLPVMLDLRRVVLHRLGRVGDPHRSERTRPPGAASRCTACGAAVDVLELRGAGDPGRIAHPGSVIRRGPGVAHAVHDGLELGRRPDKRSTARASVNLSAAADQRARTGGGTASIGSAGNGQLSAWTDATTFSWIAVGSGPRRPRPAQPGPRSRHSRGRP